MSQRTNAVQLSAYIQPDGWVHVFIDTHDLPASCTHQPHAVPKLALIVNGSAPDYLDERGKWQTRKPLDERSSCPNPS